MTSLDMHVPIKAPRPVAFDHLTSFERYADFAKAVRHVRRDPHDEQLIYLTYSIAGAGGRLPLRTTVDPEDWTVHWQSTDGPPHAVTATLEEVNPRRCALGIKIEHGSGVASKTGQAFGVLRTRLEHDMTNFADYVERAAGQRPSPEIPDTRAPSEKLFDKVFPTDETKPDPNH